MSSQANREHVVVKGETLSGIAKLYRVSLQRLLKANPAIVNPDRISVGQKIRIPTQFKSVTPPQNWADGTTIRINGSPVKDATPAEAKTVHESHLLALKMTDKSLLKLNSALEKPDDALQRLFDVGGTSTEDIRVIKWLMRRFRRIRLGLNSIPYDVDHVPSPINQATNSIGVGTGGAFAPVNGFQRFLYGNRITIFFPAFTDVVVEVRGMTLVHEVSHIVIGTNDHTYSKHGSISTKKKRTNADNYGAFAYEAETGIAY
ncbi:MAG: LysM peptidoglycan-binding domain-containing protein [Planctomycetaceae bacterium]|nr:LysM peptidoglycan-binding domain-containing protein [Planctomycetaceae bacterium]